MTEVLTIETLDLRDTTKYRITSDIRWGAPPVEYREVAGQDINRQTSGKVRGLVKAQIPLQVMGADIDEVLANIDALRAVIPRPGVSTSATLTYQRPGSSTERTTNVLWSPTLELPNDLLVRYSYEGRFVLELVREPFWYGSETTLLSAVAIAAPCTRSLGTIVGDYPAPLELTFEGTTIDFHQLVAGLLAPDSTLGIANLQQEAESGTWYGGTVSDGPTTGATGGASKKNQSTSEASAVMLNTIEMRALDAGAYLPLLRVAILDTAQTGTVRLFTRAGWSTDYEQIEHGRVTLTGTGAGSWRYEPLPQINLPPAAVTSDAAVSLLWAGTWSSSGAAGDEVALDNTTLVPASWGIVGVHGSPYDRDFNTVTFGADGSVVLDDVESYKYVVAPGPILAPPGPARLMVLAETVAVMATCGLTVTAKYRPRYAGV